MDSWVEMVLLGTFVVGLAITMLTVVTLGWTKTGRRGSATSRALNKSTDSHPVLPLLNPAANGPVRAFPVTLLSTPTIRQYRIVGVDAQTRADLDFHIGAATAANAKVKAELAGIIVTEVSEVVRPSGPDAVG